MIPSFWNILEDLETEAIAQIRFKDPKERSIFMDESFQFFGLFIRCNSAYIAFSR